jgi:hypothetical protein
VFLAGGSSEFPAMYGKSSRKTKVKMEKGSSKFSPGDGGGDSTQEVVDYWLGHLIQRPVADEKKKVLVEALAGEPEKEQNVKKMVQLIVSMPEYQLC